MMEWEWEWKRQGKCHVILSVGEVMEQPKPEAGLSEAPVTLLHLTSLIIE